MDLVQESCGLLKENLFRSVLATKTRDFLIVSFGAFLWLLTLLETLLPVLS